ncbi:hypothetical protein Clacol_007649 [Clathrus columnatus]|uniref:D-lactate dehydrogenase (cytochrome) n=1 Tax=Clathrus columnatus TaxID=1419009 RepID=A0AAV5AGC9_9AGAM|nr:hypothetical protein Clacol_007649 [Clathrus columnatus]
MSSLRSLRFNFARTRTLTGRLVSSRSVSSASSSIPITPKHNSSNSFYLSILAVSILSGVVGYSFNSSSSSSSATSSSSSSLNDAYFKNTKYGSPQDFKNAIQELRETFKDGPVDVDTTPDVLESHGFSSVNAYHEGHPYSVIVFPTSTQDVVKIVNIATKYKMPIVPYSGATSLEGQTLGHPLGGICIDLSGMDKILAINEEDSDIVVQPGCEWQEINATLKEKGIPLFFPLDPGPGATIGGMIATGCSGTNAVRYGTAKGEWFLNITAVLPNGEVIKTRQRSRKSSAGFDLTKLFVGAEGTLGIVTEATLRLAPLLPTSVAVVQFPDVKKATEATRDIINTGAGIQCIELLDSKFMYATNQFGASKRKWPEKDTLFIKLQGRLIILTTFCRVVLTTLSHIKPGPSQSFLTETSKLVQRIAAKHGGTGYEHAKSKEEADDLWADRKNAHFSTVALRPGCRSWPTDVCVPVSQLPTLVYETQKDLAETGLIATTVGHVGDGNFHTLMLIESDSDLAKAAAASDRMVKRAIALDGTCTGEHGVGLGKKKYLVDELGVETVELLKTIKRTIDPFNLFNPGKLYPGSVIPGSSASPKA